MTGLVVEASRLQREFGVTLGGLEMPPGTGKAHLESVLRELAVYGLD
jgi:uncharacterized protein (DUF58 family)